MKVGIRRCPFRTKFYALNFGGVWSGTMFQWLGISFNCYWHRSGIT